MGATLFSRARGGVAATDVGRIYLAKARAVVGVDTGLTHLAAALSVPTVALFAATPAWRFGPYWSDRAVSLGEDGRWPAPDEVLAALARLAAHG